LPAGTQIDYVFDGMNRRIGRKVDGTLVQGFLYEDQLRIVAQLDGNNNVVSRFVYGRSPNIPDYMIQGGVTYRIITDAIGSVRLVVDVGSGNIAQRLDYDAFGQVLLDTNPGFQPFGFAGGLYDPATKLIRFGARDYDPATGRWTAKDPILFAGGDTNLFAYADNDPVNFADPWGTKEGESGSIKEQALDFIANLALKDLLKKAVEERTKAIIENLQKLKDNGGIPPDTDVKKLGKEIAKTIEQTGSVLAKPGDVSGFVIDQIADKIMEIIEFSSHPSGTGPNTDVPGANNGAPGGGAGSVFGSIYP
jgi:RHS repeat-associated protein